MFAKLFIVALAVVCASAGYSGIVSSQYTGQSGRVFPLAYSAGVVPTYNYNAPIASYSTYSGTPVTYSTYSSIPSVYSAPAVRTLSYY